jgi:hypothetical protein
MATDSIAIEARGNRVALLKTPGGAREPRDQAVQVIVEREVASPMAGNAQGPMCASVPTHASRGSILWKSPEYSGDLIPKPEVDP